MTTGSIPRRWDAFDRVLALAALAAGAVIALRAPGVGDYPRDAGRALSAISHGEIGSFFSHQPAMGAVSLYLRAPFVILAAAFHDSPLGIYRLGDLPCVLSVALVATWLARAAGRRGMSRAGQALIVAMCLVNPLISDALYYGHPEELLTASLAVGSLLAACDRRVALAAVLAGLAVASKQWALLIVLPALLALERDRIRAALVMLGVAAGSTLPMVVANPAAFRHVIAFLSAPQQITTQFSWLYPFSPAGTVRITDLFGGVRTFDGHTALGVASTISHPLIIALGVAVPLLVWLRRGQGRGRGRRPSAEEILLATALVFVLRCALDPWSEPYYYFPLLLTLFALDATAGRKLPLAGLVGAAGAFTVLDRFPGYLGSEAANLLYIAATVAAVVVLVRALRASGPAGSVSGARGSRRWSPGVSGPSA